MVARMQPKGNLRKKDPRRTWTSMRAMSSGVGFPAARLELLPRTGAQEVAPHHAGLVAAT